MHRNRKLRCDFHTIVKMNYESDLDPLINNSLQPAKGIVLNKRECRTIHNEKCGRIRLGFLSIGLFLLIYICVAIRSGTDNDQQRVPPQMIVNVPPTDEHFREYEMKFINVDDDDDDDVILPTISTTTTKITTTVQTTQSPTSTTTTPPIISTTLIDPIRQTVPDGYLVYSTGCQMPALDPLAKDVMKLFRKEKYEECTSTKPLTSIYHNHTSDEVFLMVNEKLKSSFYYRGNNKLNCCYQEIKRGGGGVGKYADDKFDLSSCTSFTKTIQIKSLIEFLLIRCKSGSKTTYINTHAIVRRRPDIQDKLNKFQGNYNTRPLSVLMLSIDSISRLNLIRAMPQTAEHLYDNGWFELQGYNKIDDNTFPNLMAILVGYNSSLAYNVCAPTVPGSLEKCPFIWNYFRDNGYVTAYGEDEASISTFNYHKTGFIQQPTDFYMRPYLLAAEKNLQIKHKHSLTYCLGYKHSVDHIYDYALDFVTTYKNESFFGLFWTNTFSHNDISDPSSMDGKMKQYIVELETRGILNNSMVVFFSDHGLRFGSVRHLITGWLEERLPFIFIWLPKWFRDEHPTIVQTLQINRNRLTNPYDLHMTLKHILELSKRIDNLPKSISCPDCQSLFMEMEWNRTCEESSIAGHWCTCSPYKKIDKNTKIVKDIVDFAIQHINDQLYRYENGTKCAKLKFKSISYVRQAKFETIAEPYHDYMFVMELSPSKGWFEATVRHYLNKKSFEVTGTISRLDMYASQSNCMKIDYLKKYCYCQKHKQIG